MTSSARRVVLVILAILAAYVGVWAVSTPANWYASFPGAGHQWLPVLGPYNEHLARDVGGLYLALAVISVGAAVRPADGYLVRLTGLAWLAFSVPHLTYHLGHLSHYATADKVANTVGLIAAVLLALLLLLPVRVRDAVTVGDDGFHSPVR
jgi:hypothetical protein